MFRNADLQQIKPKTINTSIEYTSSCIDGLWSNVRLVAYYCTVKSLGVRAEELKTQLAS